MLNSILFCALLASIGACYVWLGAKYRDREVKIAKDLREIKDIEARIEEKNLRISGCLAPEALRARTVRAGLELKTPRSFTADGELQGFDPSRFAQVPAALINASFKATGRLDPQAIVDGSWKFPGPPIPRAK